MEPAEQVARAEQAQQMTKAGQAATTGLEDPTAEQMTTTAVQTKPKTPVADLVELVANTAD